MTTLHFEDTSAGQVLTFADDDAPAGIIIYDASMHGFVFMVDDKYLGNGFPPAPRSPIRRTLEASQYDALAWAVDHRHRRVNPIARAIMSRQTQA